MNAFTEGLYLRVEDVTPVYKAGSNSAYDGLIGVSVVPFVDEYMTAGTGRPARGKRTTLPCSAYQILDLKKHDKAVQNEVLDTFKKVWNMPWLERSAAGFEHFWDMSGEEFMKKYNCWMEAEAAKAAKINEAIAFLKENGYNVFRGEA
jgi:hypothetical protein